MRVLIACEESQTVAKAFRKYGHDAFSCDILDPSGGCPGFHIKGDVLPLLNGNCSFFTLDGQHHSIDGKWDLIVAHPPCTYLSRAGARWLFPGGLLNADRYNKGLLARDFFLKFLNADCDSIAVENPVPLSVFDLPDCTQSIQPFQFGHPVTKQTCLWLKGLPPLKPTLIVEPGKGRPYYDKDGNLKYHGWTELQSKDRARQRSKTFQGIAMAMAAQWGCPEGGKDE